MDILKGFLEEAGYDKNLPKSEIKRILATDKNLRDSYFSQTPLGDAMYYLRDLFDDDYNDYAATYVAIIALERAIKKIVCAEYEDESEQIKQAEISYQNNFKKVKETLESCDDKEVSTIIWEYISYLRKIKIGELPYVDSFKAGRKK